MKLVSFFGSWWTRWSGGFIKRCEEVHFKKRMPINVRTLNRMLKSSRQWEIIESTEDVEEALRQHRRKRDQSQRTINLQAKWVESKGVFWSY